jgi:hypothetical protein
LTDMYLACVYIYSSQVRYMYSTLLLLCIHTAVSSCLLFFSGRPAVAYIIFLHCFWSNRSPYYFYSPLPPLRGQSTDKYHPSWQPK